MLIILTPLTLIFISIFSMASYNVTSQYKLYKNGEFTEV